MNKKPVLSLIFLMAVAVLYFLVSNQITNGQFEQTKVPHYNYLLNALLHKRLELAPLRTATDLSFFNGNWYMYWGPAPILFILPFYVIGRTASSDVVYTLAAGIVNVFLFYFAVYKFNHSFKLKMKSFDLLFITASFALISPHFYLSLGGQIWHTNQIISTLYLLIFIIFYFMYWQNPKRIFYVAISTVFLCLAVLSRYTLIFYFALFIPILIKFYKTKTILIIFAISLAFACIMFAYNYARFGNILETGTSYQDIRSSELVFIPASGRSSLVGLKYIKHNFETYFLNPIKFRGEAPYVEVDREGNSMFSVYPLLIFTPLLFAKHIKNKKYNLFLKSSIAVVVPILIYFMIFLGTGWAQFGLRYMLDIVPLLYILMLPTLSFIPRPIKFLILTYGVFVNTTGAIIFYTTIW